MILRFSADDLDEVGAYLGQGYCRYAFYENDYPTAAFALHLDKVTLGAVEYPAVDAYFCALSYVQFLGAKIGDLFICGCCDCNELLHLTVWDNDWDVLACYRTGVVLQEIYTLFELFYSFSCRVDEYYVVDCRYHLAAFDSIAFFNECLLHWNKAFNAFLIKKLLCLELSAVGRAHCKPNRGVLVVHGVLLLLLLPIGYNLGSLKGV